jgi:hypothetical protein
MVTVPHSGPCAHLVAGHVVGEMDGDAHVLRFDRRVGADELPVQLGGVGEPLGGAFGDVLHGEGRDRVGDLEVELHADGGATVFDAVGLELAARHADDRVVRELVRHGRRRVGRRRSVRAEHLDGIGAPGGEVPVDEVVGARELECACVVDAHVAVGHDLRVDGDARDREALGRRGAGRQGGRSSGRDDEHDEREQQPLPT